jgi:hypothetical protein
MDKTIKIVAAVFAVVVVACIAILHVGSVATGSTNGSVLTPAADTIYFFYGEECSHCHKVMPFITNMTEKYQGADIRILEVWHNETNKQLYQKANTAAGVTQYGVPEVVLEKTVLIGEVEIPNKFEGLIQEYLKKKA